MCVFLCPNIAKQMNIIVFLWKNKNLSWQINLPKPNYFISSGKKSWFSQYFAALLLSVVVMNYMVLLCTTYILICFLWNSCVQVLDHFWYQLLTLGSDTQQDKDIFCCCCCSLWGFVCLFVWYFFFWTSENKQINKQPNKNLWSLLTNTFLSCYLRDFDFFSHS